MRHIASMLPASAVLAVALGVPATVTPAGAAQAPGLIAAFDLAALPDTQFDRGWSPPADEGGTPCRKARRGKRAAVRPKGSGNSIEAGFIDSIEHTAKLIRWRNTLLDKLAGAKP